MIKVGQRWTRVGLLEKRSLTIEVVKIITDNSVEGKIIIQYDTNYFVGEIIECGSFPTITNSNSWWKLLPNQDKAQQ